VCECSGSIPQRGMKVKIAFCYLGRMFCTIDRPVFLGYRFECEHTCWDPKDGELCLSRAKPGETLVEVRSDSNVQIDRRTWV